MFFHLPSVDMEILRLRQDTELNQTEIAERLEVTDSLVHKVLRRYKLNSRALLKNKVDRAKEMAASGMLSVDIRKELGVSSALFSRWKKTYNFSAENHPFSRGEGLARFPSIPEGEVDRIRADIEAGVQQWTLAHKYGVSQSTISRYCKMHSIQVPQPVRRPRKTG